MIRGGAALALLIAVASSASAQDGAALFEPCRACHALDPAAKPMAGPNLAGLLGRKVAADPKFDYSPVLQQARDEGRVWTADSLGAFITDPEAVFPGTWMSRLPIPNPADRQALVRFITDPASR
jgi:cytochrome c